MVFFFAVFAARAPAMGTARTERGSSHSSWKGSRLLSAPAMADCLACRPDIVCPNKLGGMMQPCQGCPRCVSHSPKARFRALARRARFPTRGVLRVAGDSVVWDCVPTPVFPLKSTKRSAAAIRGRSAPSFLFMVRFGLFCCRQDPCHIAHDSIGTNVCSGFLAEKFSLIVATSKSNRFYP